MVIENHLMSDKGEIYMKRYSGRSFLARSIAVVIIAFLLIIVPFFRTGSGGEATEIPTRTDESDDLLSGTMDLSIESMEQYIGGDGEDDMLGYSVATGDINTDGKDDIILGAPGYNGSTGAVLFFMGGLKGRQIGYEDADVIIEHYEIGTLFGRFAFTVAVSAVVEDKAVHTEFAEYINTVQPMGDIAAVAVTEQQRQLMPSVGYVPA